MAELLKGAPVAQALSERIQENCRRLEERGITPTFGIVRVGERPDDLAYERGACKRAEKLGVRVKKIQLPADVTEEEILQAARELAQTEEAQ